MRFSCAFIPAFAEDLNLFVVKDQRTCRLPMSIAMFPAAVHGFDSSKDFPERAAWMLMRFDGARLVFLVIMDMAEGI